MKKIFAFLLIFAFMLGYSPDSAMSDGTKVSIQTHKSAAPKAPETSAKISSSTAENSRSFSIVPSYTLSDCYQMALIQSEIIAINADRIKEADAHFLMALSTVMPHVGFVSVNYQRDVPLDRGTSIASLSATKGTENYFNLTQTLFNGFKAIAGVRGAGSEKKQRIEEKTRAEQLLLMDVANAFYLLKEQRDDLKVLNRIKKALKDRIDELRGRERLGRSRPSEVVNAKAQLYNVEASIEQVKAQEVIVRQLLEFLIGQPVKEVIDTYKFPIDIMTEDYYVSKAFLRPDVNASKFAWDLAKQNIIVVDSDFLPQADLSANYYTQSTDYFGKGDKWDVALTIDVPIFDGTEVLGRSKEANLQADERKQEYHRLKRKAPYDIKDSYVGLQAAMSVHDKLRKAYHTAKLNYHLQKKDYERSLVNNLDVLAAINTLESSERDYIHALYEAKRRYWQLRVAAGESGTESLDDTI